MKFAVLYGSTRRNRHGIHVARFVVSQLEKRGHDVTLLDAKELDLPMLDLMYKEYDGDAPEKMKWAHDVLEAAEGFVVIGAEYNHSVPPGLKNMLDTFQQEFYYKPAGIVSYSAGPFGGARAAPHYRVILGELGMVTTSVMFSVSSIFKTMGPEGDLTENKDYERRIARFLNELEWYTEGLSRQRQVCSNPMEPCGDRNLEEQVA